MSIIVLIACASKKRLARAKAADLYSSPLFELSLRYARQVGPDAIFILSAKHGLLALEDEIEPYNVTLTGMPARERRNWAARVIRQLRERADPQNDHFVLLCGEKYREYLIPWLASYEVPMKGLQIGKQLQWLKEQVGDE